MGKSGLVTINLPKYLEKNPSIEPEYFFLLRGNDLLHNVNKNDVVNNLQSFLDDLIKLTADCVCIVLKADSFFILYLIIKYNIKNNN